MPALKEVQAGETIIILNATTPVARLTAIPKLHHDARKQAPAPRHRCVTRPMRFDRLRMRTCRSGGCDARPFGHLYPFDRLLVAAALGATATILTPDQAIHEYPVSCRW